MPKITRDDAALSRNQKAILVWLLEQEQARESSGKGFEHPRRIQWRYRPVGRTELGFWTFDGKRLSKSARASGSRTRRRLIERGLMVAHCSKVELTEKGREIAKRLASGKFDTG